MNYKKNNFLLVLFPLLILLCIACNKSNGPSGQYKLSYGDSIIYLKAQSQDHIVYPIEHRAGTYYGFPDGIEIDDDTGEINVSKSETGLRYRITHVSPDGVTTTTMVVLSGITYFDKYYNLSLGDSIAIPVYNANENRSLPLTGSVFDSDNTANSGGCSVKTTNGQINLAESLRNGIFGNNPSNDDKREFDIVYKLNDNSGKATNKIRVKLYYYDSMADVAPDLLETLQEREDQDVFLRVNNGNPFNYTGSTARTAGVARPRPPCVIIIGQ
jgi:hypothetical protein